MNLLDVLRETDIIKEAEGTIGDVVAGETEKKRWENMTSKEQAAELRKREEAKEENKDKSKEWFDEWEAKTLEKIKSKEANLKAAQRAGGLAKAGTTSMSKERREAAMKKADNIKASEGKYYDMDYKDAIAEYDDASKNEREQIIRRIAREISKDKREANNILSNLNKIEDKESIKVIKDAIDGLVNPEGKGKHSQTEVKKNVVDVSKKVDAETAKSSSKDLAKQIVTSWKGSGKDEEEAITKFVKDGENKAKAKSIIKNYMPEEIQKAIDNADETQLKKMGKDLIDLWKKDYVILQKFAKGMKGIDEDEAKEIIKDVNEKGRKNFEVVLNALNRGVKAFEGKKGEKAEDSDLSVEGIMKAIEERKALKNKMYQLFLDKGDTEAASKEAMKDQSPKEKRRWELMNKKDLTDEEKDELDRLQNEETEMSNDSMLTESVDENDFSQLYKKSVNKTKLLKESFGYKGVNFEVNYYASMILKTFLEDFNKYGKGIVNFYEDAWGTWDGAFREAADNMEKLNEEMEMINNKSLLFEALPDQLASAAAGASGGKFNLFRRATNAVSYGRTGSVLGSMWQKIKGLGKNFFENGLMPFLQSGFTWAKGLATKGLAFFKGISPQVAIPIALGVAGITSIAALKNRKKRKKLEQLLSKNDVALAKVQGENAGLMKYLEQSKKLNKIANKEGESGNTDSKSA